MHAAQPPPTDREHDVLIDLTDELGSLYGVARQVALALADQYATLYDLAEEMHGCLDHHLRWEFDERMIAARAASDRLPVLTEKLPAWPR